MATKFKNYCVTDFILCEQFWKDFFIKEKCTYMYIGKEICPKTKKGHFQLFFCFKSQRSFKAIMKKVKPRHIEAIAGTVAQNKAYCSKEGVLVYEDGKLPKQGERNDLMAVKEEIMEGKRVDDIIMDDPMFYHQYGRTLTKIEDIVLRKKYRTEMTKAIWYWGGTGVGKSHKAFEDFDPETHYVVPNDNGWWDGYTQQETVIFNDFRGELSYNVLLQLVDKWPMNVKRRCREPMPFTSRLVIITSSLPPEKIYHRRDGEDNIGQLLRRIEIIKMDTKWSEGNTIPLTLTNVEEKALDAFGNIIL